MRHLLMILFVAACSKSTEPPITIAPPSPSMYETNSPAGIGSAPPPASTAPPIGSPNACSADTDCTYGEIGRELLKKEDCPCLLGCPGIAMNKTTNARREAQYRSLCTPMKDGRGHACPIDDCLPPATPKCISGTCR